MTMNLEYITPAFAKRALQNNPNNRKLRPATVCAYAADIINGQWDENTGATISFDDSGALRDGQHRLSAIVMANKGVKMWVCRGVDPDALFDNNVVRCLGDQLTITRGDIPPVYKNHRVAALVKDMANHEVAAESGRKATTKEVTAYIDEHRHELDGYVFNIPIRTNATRLNISAVHIALYLAYINGVDIEDIREFYNVLTSGVCDKPEYLPVVALRDKLLLQKVAKNGKHTAESDVAYFQDVLMKFLTRNCSKRLKDPDKCKMIWNYPARSNV